MDVDQLFSRTLADLEQRNVSDDEYEVLMSAVLLRKLLMDRTTLVDQVNSAYKLKITYPMNGVSRYEQMVYEDVPMFWSLLDAIDPENPVVAGMPGMRVPVDASRDKFLARRIMRMNGTWITVRDLIAQLAHIDGAVHSGQPQNEREKVLQAAAKFFRVGSTPGGVAQVRSIGRVVLRGLAPLREAVVSAHTPSRSA